MSFTLTEKEKQVMSSQKDDVVDNEVKEKTHVEDSDDEDDNYDVQDVSDKVIKVKEEVKEVITEEDVPKPKKRVVKKK